MKRDQEIGLPGPSMAAIVRNSRVSIAERRNGCEATAGLSSTYNFGASEATNCLKRGSLRSGSQLGSTFRYP